MRRSQLPTVAMVALLAVAACGGPTPGTGPGPGAQTPAQPAAATPAAPQLATSLTIATPAGFSHLDRQIYAGTSGLTNQLLNYNVAETLVKMDATGKVQPLLAQRWEVTQPGTIRFHLRTGVTFSDGTPWNAEVAKANFDRMMTLKGGAWKNEFPSVTKVAVAGELVFDITHSPDPNIPKIFAVGGRQFSGKQIKENADSIATKPIGTGPYTVESFDKSVGLTLKARDGYWGTAPTLKTITVAFRPEPAARVAMLKSGEADLITDILPDDAKGLEAAAVVKAEGFEVYNFRFGLKDPLSSDVRIRQAINLAIDRKQMLALFSGFADVPAGNQLWPSWSTGWATRPEVKADLEKAKALVTEAGAAGKEIAMVTGVGRWIMSGEVAEAAAEMIRKTGLKVSLKKASHDDWKNINRDLKSPPAVVWGSMGNEAGDATENLVKKYMCGGELSTYCSQEFDAAAKAARAETDPAKRTTLVQKAQDILERDLPYLGLVTPQILYGKKAKLTFAALPGAMLAFGEMKLAK